MGFILRGRRSICWGWRLTLLALRIGNDVSYETRIKHEMQFAWQVQYLVRFEVDFACSALSKWRFICDADQSWDSFCVAGAVFGEVGLSLFVAGAAFGDILGDSRSAKCCIFQYKIVSKIGRVRSPKRRVRDDDFMVGSWSDYPRIVFILAEAIQRVSAAILNLKISWQAQYLLRLEVDIACSAHWKWRFIWDAHQSWDSFCVAGAVFGEVGLSLFVAGAAFGDILGDSRSANCCIFPYKMRLQGRTSKVSEAAGARWRFHGRIMVGLSSNRLYIGGSNSESFRCNLELKDFVAGAVFAEVGGWHCLLCALEMKFHMRRGSNMRFILRGRRSICWGWRLTLLALRIGNEVSYETRIKHEMHFAWQAQYLVRFEVDIACSAHSKWRFICDADQSWDSFCVAGAIFGEVRGWLCLLPAF